MSNMKTLSIVVYGYTYPFIAIDSMINMFLHTLYIHTCVFQIAIAEAKILQ